jgi:hypothetical protein
MRRYVRIIVKEKADVSVPLYFSYQFFIKLYKLSFQPTDSEFRLLLLLEIEDA